jgi:glycerol-3-phosphate dehydrogenase
MDGSFDALVIGGGITGAGVYRELRRRGMKTALIEARSGLGLATTANSSRLIHGGLRYLLYDPDTAAESCRDAGRILAEFPDLLERLPFLWPVYEGDRHGLETVESLLEVYDGLGPTKNAYPHLRFGAEAARRIEPGLSGDRLLGALSFEEWRVDPVRLTRRVVESEEPGAGTVIRGAAVVEVAVGDGGVRGVRLSDGRSLSAPRVVNAAGPWADRIAAMAGVAVPLRLRKGIHLVFSEWKPRCAILAEGVGGSRHIFAVPVSGGSLVGPTDTPYAGSPSNAEAKAEEIAHLDRSMRRVFPDMPSDHSGVRVGVRPIVAQSGPGALLSRDFEIFDHGAREGVRGFMTVAGGKMTTFPTMAEAAARALCDGDAAAAARARGKWRSLVSGLASVGAAFGRHQLRRMRGGGSESSVEEFERNYGTQ